jgi:threonyl-tRNA synthetase
MKKQNKPKPSVIKELASQFEAELNKSLPITVRKDGSLLYKSFIIKQNNNNNWAIYHAGSKDSIDEFYLKTCALMAAKAYQSTNLNRYFEIKRLDNKYWANYSDNQVYKRNIKTAKDSERFMILLNKLEDSEAHANHFKEEISRMFKWSFV